MKTFLHQISQALLVTYCLPALMAMYYFMGPERPVDRPDWAGTALIATYMWSYGVGLPFRLVKALTST